jgi:nitrite reductase/ring-hydroxylating ferredoxin subunit
VERADERQEEKMSSWVKLGMLSELSPGTGRHVRLADRAVALFNVDGEVYAIDGSCTHRGGPLGEGRLEGSVVTCPWHGARFDVRTGVVLSPPARTNAEVYRVSLETGVIAVELPDRVSSSAR